MPVSTLEGLSTPPGNLYFSVKFTEAGFHFGKTDLDVFWSNFKVIQTTDEQQKW
jgi:hypothetical protein